MYAILNSSYLRYQGIVKLIYTVTKFMLIIFGIFLSILILRLDIEDRDLTMIIAKISNYAFGMYYAHSDWVHAFQFVAPSGSWNCCGLIKQLADVEKVPGMYGLVDTPAGETNIFLNSHKLELLKKMNV